MVGRRPLDRAHQLNSPVGGPSRAHRAHAGRYRIDVPIRLPLALLLLVAFLAACSSEPSVSARDQVAEAVPTPTEAPTATAESESDAPVAPVDEPPAEDTDGSRIAIQAADSILTVLPDGSDPIALGDAANLNAQPTWSADAGFIAWSSTDPLSGATAVAASRFDGSAAHRADTAGPVSAIAWDATSSVIAYLAGVPSGQQLSTAAIVEPGPEQAIDTGSPYWFTWAPTDQEFLVHADGFRVDRVTLDGTTVGLSTESAGFQTPVWLNAERALLFADDEPDGAALVSTGEEGEGRRPLIDFDGYLRIVANPDANRVAVHVNERAPDVAEIITAAFQTEPVAPTSIDRGRLTVVSVFGGSPVSVDRLAAEAFLWDAQGQILAYLVQISEGDEPWFEWRFFGPDGITSGPLHQLTDVFTRNYLPYFDQLANDVTFFSPDASQFVFAGRTLDGDEGIWMHTIGDASTVTRIADGEFATWSPGPAGGGGRSVL